MLERNKITLDLTLTKEKARLPSDTEYTVYASTGPKCEGESNYRELTMAKYEVQTDGTVVLKMVDAVLNPEGESWRYTHLQVYTKNMYGKSKYCSTTALLDLPPKQPEEEL